MLIRCTISCEYCTQRQASQKHPCTPANVHLLLPYNDYWNTSQHSSSHQPLLKHWMRLRQGHILSDAASTRCPYCVFCHQYGRSVCHCCLSHAALTCHDVAVPCDGRRQPQTAMPWTLCSIPLWLVQIIYRADIYRNLHAYTSSIG